MKALLLILVCALAGCDSEETIKPAEPPKPSVDTQHNKKLFEMNLPSLEFQVKSYEIDKSSYLAICALYKNSQTISPDVEVGIAEERQKMELSDANLKAEMEKMEKIASGPAVRLRAKNDIGRYNESVISKRDIWLLKIRALALSVGTQEEVNETYQSYSKARDSGVFLSFK